MYSGEVNVAQDTVERFLDVAKSLMVKGLTEKELDIGNETEINRTAVKNKISTVNEPNATSKKRLAENPPILEAKRRKINKDINGPVSETRSSITPTGHFLPHEDDELIINVTVVSFKEVRLCMRYSANVEIFAM